jgi:hypothetical protein
VTAHHPALCSRRSIAASLSLLFAAVFSLPYLVRVSPSVSLSYLVGYSNRAAYLLFALGSVLFATLYRKCFSEAEQVDQPLGLPSLATALAIACGCCAYRLFPSASHHIGSEAAYALNRIQMLLSGSRPYRDFEFAYGPAHLYLPAFFAFATHASVIHGYYLWWLLQWFLGTGMLWAAIRLLPFPLPRRRIVFWLIFLIQLPGIDAEGTAYTPTRNIGSAFFVLVVAVLSLRRKSPALIAATALLCIAAAFAISPEQGFAVLASLLVWFLLLMATRQRVLTLGTTAIFLLGAAVILLCCWRMGEFSTLLAFAGGAYSFPLLPSPTNIVILAGYVAAACEAIHALSTRRFDSAAIPMFLAGYALLPAAMGRCDIGHLLIAAPALFLGVAAIEGRPALRLWWSPLAALLVVIPFLILPFYLRHYPQEPTNGTLAKPGSSFDPVVLAHHPCPSIYRSPNVAPKPFETAADDCLDTGRYDATVNAFTPQAVNTILQELQRQPLRPIVLPDVPLADQLAPEDASLSRLYILELSPWLPHPRNPPFTYQQVRTYIERNYVPSPAPIGSFRIWYPAH